MSKGELSHQVEPSSYPSIETPVPHLSVPRTFDAVIEYPPVKALIPVPIILLIAPLVWLLFRSTWNALDEEARAWAAQNNKSDYRAMVCLVMMAIVLTIHDYYGGRSFFTANLQPIMLGWEQDGWKFLQVKKFADLYGYGWWSFARIFGYVAVPLLTWKILFPRDSVLDMGLRTKGFFGHLWIYGLCLAVVFSAMAILSQQEDFLTYYPFYKGSSRSWFDLLTWEALYFAQFFALEFYFRGFVLETLRKRMGASAIFVMAVPYCMIHYGKPYLEAHGAIIAGVVLGSLAMRTRSIYAGFLVHITVAGLMDYYALVSRNGLPTKWWP